MSVSQDRPLRLALVGAGLITERSHLPAARSCRGVSVSAIVDPALDRARRLAASVGPSVRSSERLAEVLADVDAALIAAPNHLHCPLALECIEAGVHTLIEKPLALSLEEGNAIAEAASRKGVTVGVGYQTRFRPSVQLMKQLLGERRFGAVRRFVFQFGTRGGWAPVSGYNLDRGATGGGVLVVAGSHLVERMIHWFGYPAVEAYEDDSDGGPEANVRARFRFPSTGVEGLLQLSKTDPLDGGFAMETEAGVVTLRDQEGSEITLRGAGDSYETVFRATKAARGGEYRLQLEDFVRACRDGGEPAVSLSEALAAQRLTDELYAARRRISPIRAGHLERRAG